MISGGDSGFRARSASLTSGEITTSLEGMPPTASLTPRKEEKQNI